MATRKSSGIMAPSMSRGVAQGVSLRQRAVIDPSSGSIIPNMGSPEMGSELSTYRAESGLRSAQVVDSPPRREAIHEDLKLLYEG